MNDAIPRHKKHVSGQSRRRRATFSSLSSRLWASAQSPVAPFGSRFAIRALLVFLALVQSVQAHPGGGGDQELIAAVSRNYTHFNVIEGCYVVGNNLAQMNNAQGHFPFHNIEACSIVQRCTGFQVYVRPGDTTRSVFVEYKSDCTILPASACRDPLPPPEGSPETGLMGGKWYAFHSTVRCPPLANLHAPSFTGGVGEPQAQEVVNITDERDAIDTYPINESHESTREPQAGVIQPPVSPPPVQTVGSTDEHVEAQSSGPRLTAGTQDDPPCHQDDAAEHLLPGDEETIRCPLLPPDDRL